MEVTILYSVPFLFLYYRIRKSIHLTQSVISIVTKCNHMAWLCSTQHQFC